MKSGDEIKKIIKILANQNSVKYSTDDWKVGVKDALLWVIGEVDDELFLSDIE